MRSWGAEFHEIKDVVRAFKKYDENDGGVMLFDEWIQFAKEYHLVIEQDSVIINNSKKPRIVYKQHIFLRAGTKRPNLINPNLWHQKRPQKNLELELEELLKKSKDNLTSGLKRPSNIYMPNIKRRSR